MIDGHEEMTCPVSSALKNLAKVHGLPPFTALYSSGRIALVAAEEDAAVLWRQALALPPFNADGRTEGFWMGDQIRLVIV